MAQSVKVRKIDRMAGLSFENALRLHFDSITLFNNKSFPSAYFLSILAVEEIGKAFLLMDLIFHKYCGEVPDNESHIDWIKRIYSHNGKQKSFAFNFDIPVKHNNYTELFWKGDMEKLKQNSVYVGLKCNKNNINLKSKINNPLKLTEKKAKNQITVVNDCLLDLIIGVIKGAYELESLNIEKSCNEDLYNKLKDVWPFIKPKTKSRLLEIEKLE